MKFSVIVPIYNSRKYLEQCIHSILAQTYIDYELILVDDGSTDGSGDLCDLYYERFPSTIKVIHQENAGVMSARISGLKHCSGEYVYFCDSDDYLDRSLLEKMNVIIETSYADLILFSYQWVNIDGERISHDFPHFYSEETISKEILFKTWMQCSDLNNIWLKVIKHDLADWQEFTHPAYQIPNGEDLIMSLLYVQYADVIRYIDIPLYYHRLNPSSAVFNCIKGCQKDVTVAYPLFFDFLQMFFSNRHDRLHNFFIQYKKIVYQRAKMIAASRLSKQDKYAAFLDIISCNLFCKAMKEFSSDCIPLRKRVFLNLLFKGHYNIVICYGVILTMLDKRTAKIRNALQIKRFCKIEKTQKKMLRGGEGNETNSD